MEFLLANACLPSSAPFLPFRPLFVSFRFLFSAAVIGGWVIDRSIRFPHRVRCYFNHAWYAPDQKKRTSGGAEGLLLAERRARSMPKEKCYTSIVRYRTRSRGQNARQWARIAYICGMSGLLTGSGRMEIDIRFSELTREEWTGKHIWDSSRGSPGN